LPQINLNVRAEQRLLHALKFVLYLFLKFFIISVVLLNLFNLGAMQICNVAVWKLFIHASMIALKLRNRTTVGYFSGI